MDEEAKDRVAACVNEQIERYLRGTPEEKLTEEFDGLTREEQLFAVVLLDRLIAYEDEQQLAA